MGSVELELLAGLSQGGAVMHIRGALHWLLRRKIELGIFALGVLLRLSMIWNYAHDWSYDYAGHWELIEWIVKHRIVPPTHAVFMAFHPPLFYSVAAGLVSLGVSEPAIPLTSTGCRTARPGCGPRRPTRSRGGSPG